MPEGEAPKISVLLPYRDAEATLAEAVSSLLDDRDAPPFELLVVDDGSRDGGPEIARASAREDPRVRLLHSRGRGLVAALEVARAAASAPFLARMDADDRSLPGRLSAQLHFLEAHRDVAALGTRTRPFPSDQVEAGLRRYVEWQNGALTPADHRRAIFVESPLCHPSVMMRATAVAAVGGYRDGAFAEDYDLWLRLDRQGHALAKLPDVLLEWRHRQGRLTFTDSRYSRAAMRRQKAPFLAYRLHRFADRLTVWGAGREGRRLVRELERFGIAPRRFVDIDPKKIGREARGRPILPPDALDPAEDFVLAAVASRGAREEIAAALEARGFGHESGYLCAS